MVDTFIDEQMEQPAPLHHGCRTDHSPRLDRFRQAKPDVFLCAMRTFFQGT